MFCRCLWIIVLGLAWNLLHADKLIVPETGWQVNHFRDASSGVKLTVEPGPDGQPALNMDCFGETACNVWLGGEAMQQLRTNWPVRFHGLHAFFWNDGQLTRLALSFRIDPQTQFNATINLQHQGWQLVPVSQMTNFKDKGAVLSPNLIESMLVRCVNRRNFRFGMGTLHWIPAGTDLLRLPTGNLADSPQTPTPPRLDGSLDDPTWAATAELPLAHLAHNHHGSPRHPAWIKTAWDDTAFYIAAQLPGLPASHSFADSAHDDPLWENEDFEFWLFPEPDQRQYYHFMANPNGIRADLARQFSQVADQVVTDYKNWNPSWQAATARTETGWSLEAAIPWTTINCQAPPKILQFQAMRCDFSDPAKPQYAIWTPVLRRPIDGFGFLNLRPAPSQTLDLSELQARRLDSGEILINATLAQIPAAELDLTVWFNNPYDPPQKHTFTHRLQQQGRHLNLRFPITPVNGYHQLVVAAHTAEWSGAAAVTFQQTLPSRTDFSALLLNPAPKNLTRGDGSFILRADDTLTIPEQASERTAKTAAFLADKIAALYGHRLPIRRGGRSRLTLQLDPPTVNAEIGPQSAEAYRISITPAQIDLTGQGESGLYYSVITLGQIMLSPKQPAPPLPALAIADWPSYARRHVTMYEQGHLRKAVGDGRGYRLDMIKEWLRRYVAGNKINLLGLGFADNVNYPSLPSLHHPDNFSPQEINEICTFAREHFIEIMPAILFGAHSNHWSRHFPELVEETFGTNQLDASNPAVYELMEKLFSDIIQMCGTPLNLFFTLNDEWWHINRTASNASLKGESRQHWFAQFLLAEYEILKRHGLRMATCSDMLLPTHNGGEPFNLARVAEKLPRDIIINSWSDSNEFFHELGFLECWRGENGFSANFRRPHPQDRGFGTINYPFIDSLFNHVNEGQWLKFCFHTQLQSAHFAWNGPAGDTLPMAEWTLQNMPNLMGLYSAQPQPEAGTELTARDIPTQTTAWDAIPAGTALEIGNIPMRLGTIEISAQAPWTLPLPDAPRLSAFYILANCAPAGPEAIATLRRDYKNGQPYGLIIGRYILHYQDGSRADLPIRLGRNIALWNQTDPQCRFIKESRAVYPLTDDQRLALNQLELVNPHPERPLNALEIAVSHPDAPILLAAITTRTTRKQ